MGGVAESKCKVLLRALDLRLHKQCRFYAPLAGRAAAPGHGNGSGGVPLPLLLRGGEPRRAAGLPGGKQKRKDMCYRRRGTGEEQQKEKKRVTWPLFSLSARALLGTVVPAGEEAAAGRGAQPAEAKGGLVKLRNKN